MLKRIGEDAGVDDVHGAICDGDNDNRSDGGDSSCSCAGTAAVIEPSSEVATGVSTGVSLSVEQAEMVDTSHAILDGLQEALDKCRIVGAVGSAAAIQREMRGLKRSQRAMIAEDDAVADAFLQRRRAEAEEASRTRRVAERLNQSAANVRKLQAEHAAAVAAMKKLKDDMKRGEAHIECQHAMKSFTPEMLGAGLANGGGAASRKIRFDVLDRMARIGSGLSPGQRNDFAAFKQSWDAKMLNEYRSDWAMTFISWIQNVLDAPEPNAFSLFVYNESRRLFHGTIALHIP